MRTHGQVRQHVAHYENPDGALITDKKSSVKQWTLLTRNDYDAEGKGPIFKLVKMGAKEAAVVGTVVISTPYKYKL